MELILLGVCLFILAFNLLVSTLRGARKSVLRLITAVLAMVVSFFLARALANAVAELLMPMIERALGGSPTFAPFFNGEIPADDVIAVFAKMLVAPLLFLLLYMVLKLLFLIIFAILKALTVFLKPFDKLPVSRLLGALTGIVIAAIGILVFVTPIFGYFDIVSATADAFVEDTAADEAEGGLTLASINADYVKPALHTPVLSLFYNKCGNKLFDGLTKQTWNEQEVYLRGEVATITDIIVNIGKLGGHSISEFGNAECAAIDRVAADVSASPLLSGLFADTVSTASKYWLAGQSFMGVQKPDIGVNGNLVFHSLLQVFATASDKTVAEDLDFFADVFRLAIEDELFTAFSQSGANDAEISTLLADSGFFADVQKLLAEHPRMKPLGTALVDVGMRVMLQEMGLPEDLRESCGEILEDMTTTLQTVPVKEDGSLDETVLAEELTTIFVDNELNVSEEATHLIAEGITDHITAEEIQNLSTDELIGKLIERFGEVDISGLSPDTPPQMPLP
ncbi:MAG: CvpA family protein [Clostridia bacterium]|nr:CvpA family protein [Clostridia bacterium]